MKGRDIIKRTLVFNILLIQLLVLASCYNYKGWKTVEEEGYGSFKIPKEWMLSQIKGKYYISNKPFGEPGCEVYLSNNKTDSRVI